MENHKQTPAWNNNLMKYGMWACCAVMLLPIVAILVVGGSLGGIFGNIWLIAPLALCVGAHFFMHRVMGKSCHDDAPGKDPSEAVDTRAVATTGSTATGT